MIIYHIGIYVNIPLRYLYNVFGDKMKLRIKDIREDNDLLQKDVADYLQCTQVCYSRYENGKRDIPLESLCKLAKFYNTTTDYLLGLTDKK